MTDLLLKLQKQLFLLTLATAVFAGFSIAYLTTTLTTVFLPVSTIVSGGSSSSRGATIQTRSADPVENYYGIVTGNLFRDSAATLNQGSLAADKGAAQVEVPQTEGDFLLDGVVAGDRSFARAAMTIEGEHESSEYAIGQTIVGYRLLSIDIDSVLVKAGTLSLRVHVGEKTSELKKKLAESGVKVDTNSGGPGPAAPGAERITLARSRLLQLTRDQAELYKNKFTPIMRDGKILGFKLIYVPTNNFLYEMGARSGDIIRRINGQPMDNTSRMIEFYQNIKTLDRVTVDVERGGKIVPYEIIVK